MRYQLTYRRLFVLIVCLILLLTVSCTTTYSDGLNTGTDHANNNNPAPRVLLISSYSPSFETFFQQVEGINYEFEDMDVVLDIEFMDSKRLYTEENINNFYTNLKYKLNSLPSYDLILSADDNALNFILKYKAELFNNTPIIFFGVNDLEKANLANEDPNITGIVEAASIYETIEIATKINSSANRVIAIVDNTPSGQADLVMFYNLSNKFHEIEFTELNVSNLTSDNYIQELNAISKSDIVLLLSFYCDVTMVNKCTLSKDNYNNSCRNKLSFDEGLQILLEHCDQPVYHPYYHGLGDGVLGGKVISHFEQGRLAASIANSVLAGNAMPNDLILGNESNKYIFDYAVLEQYGLNEKALPLNTEYINKNETLFERYKNYIIYILLFVLLLFVIIASLVYQVFKKNKAESELRQRNLDLNEQKNKTNDILKLTSKINSKNQLFEDKESFLSELLETSIEVIDEADYGSVFVYKEGVAEVIDVIGHDRKIIGFKFEGFLSTHTIKEVIRLQNGGDILLDMADNKSKVAIQKYIKSSSESLVIVLSYNEEKIAGMVLEKADGYFSDESYELANTLRNIPMAFFSQYAFYQEQNSVIESILESIIKILSLHNEYTKNHSTNVANISVAIAETMGLSNADKETIYWTGLVHDIGKIFIPESILDKADKLTETEKEIINKHPLYGYEALVDNPSLKEIAKYVLHHHERWDGSGYPYNLSKEDIPLFSRILSVADAFDAMIDDRPYRKALTKESAISEIKKNAGTQFDPQISRIFLENIDRIIG